MSEDRLSEKEQKLFDQLERVKEPPTDLEAKIIKQLKSEGQIINTKPMNTTVKWISGIAASVLLFLGGMYFGQSGQEQLAIEPTKGYMLILHEEEDFSPGDPMEMFEEYGAWMQRTFERGVKITGQELKNEASVVKGNQVSFMNEDVSRKTTGYFILEASSIEEAIEVAKENPHVKYGGIVEVKSFMVR